MLTFTKEGSDKQRWNKPMGSRDHSGAYGASGLGRLLRAHHDGIIREPLPARWTELIKCLDDKERIRLKAELKHGDESAPLKP
jgi:hypothetical protein